MNHAGQRDVDDYRRTYLRTLDFDAAARLPQHFEHGSQSDAEVRRTPLRIEWFEHPKRRFGFYARSGVAHAYHRVGTRDQRTARTRISSFQLQASNLDDDLPPCVTECMLRIE